MKLDTGLFEIKRLREGLLRHQREPSDEQVRDGLIQRFEFTYELSHRILRRYLKEISASPDCLLRSDWAVWRRFREMRTRTSHTYDANTASQIVAEIPAFLEAEHLLAELQRRLA